MSNAPAPKKGILKHTTKKVHFEDGPERTPSPSFSASPPASPLLRTPPTVPAVNVSSASSPHLTASPQSRRGHVRTPSPLSLSAYSISPGVVLVHPALVPNVVAWDMARPPSEVRASQPQSHFMYALTPETLAASATQPPLPQLMIRVTDTFPWVLTIRPSMSSNSSPMSAFVTVGDVLAGVYEGLKRQVTQQEYAYMGALRSHANDGFNARIDRVTDPKVKEAKRNEGMRRVDVLGRYCIFAGLMAGKTPGEFTVHLRRSA